MCAEYKEEVQNKRKMITGETSKLGSCRARLSWFLTVGKGAVQSRAEERYNHAVEKMIF